jgi:hypothetical protein
MRQFFVDGTGAFSMARLCLFLVVVAIVLVFLAGNVAMVFNAFKHGQPVNLIDFKEQMVWALGVAFAAKTIQSATGEK